MAQVADHLSVSALEEKYRSCTDVTAARPGHLASGQRARHRRGFGHGVVGPALGRASAGALQG